MGQPASASALLSRQCSIRARLATFSYICPARMGLMLRGGGLGVPGCCGPRCRAAIASSARRVSRLLSKQRATSAGGRLAISPRHTSLSPRRWAARTWLKMVESFSQSPRTSIHGLPRGALSSRLESSWCVWGEISSGGELADHNSASVRSRWPASTSSEDSLCTYSCTPASLRARFHKGR